MEFSLTSSSFDDGGPIPRIHTSDGQDLSPPLLWTGLPAGTRSLTLIVDDPDVPDPAAPERTWVHWLVYNIPPTVPGLPQGVGERQLPRGARTGLNDWCKPGWAGPDPICGIHRYFHKLYALDTVLPDLARPTKSDLERAMRNHVLGVAQLVGTYGRVLR